ncbi:MAG TPA: CDP-diacylglycerol--serine O-phosphatidyltransferase [Acidobacteriota bacterium]|nr:CDP-diacylglycerol--serine O-phosphatidyltransferase [Acidobacteriota bacterium]
MKKPWLRKRGRRWGPEQYHKGMYIIPSFFTISNIFCGFFSITSAIRGDFEVAGILIGIAMILDTLDGRIARMTHTTSAFGVQLDSLADVITFGVAPGILCYQWAFVAFQDPLLRRAGWLICFLFLICAASRLARFNVQTTGLPDKRYFVGLPTPPAAGMVASTVFCFPDGFGKNYPLLIATLLVMFLLSFLMVSRIKYRSFKDINLKQPHSWRVVVLMAAAIIGVLIHPQIGLLILAALYVVSGMVGYLFGRRKSHTEAPVTPPVAEQPKAN